MYLQFPSSNQGDKGATLKWDIFFSPQILFRPRNTNEIVSNAQDA